MVSKLVLWTAQHIQAKLGDGISIPGPNSGDGIIRNTV